MGQVCGVSEDTWHDVEIEQNEAVYDIPLCAATDYNHPSALSSHIIQASSGAGK